ncbi:VanZ family protein [Peribacillus aracenensis]|uniref:VanZ family protein n=1 Tax=Peribacillus aracenensis TaxID=2976708 RepID=UPI0021A32F16|nr:VanZ family protein [Peribacillus sp. BBB004]
MKKTKLMNRRVIVLALFVFYMYALLRIILFKFRWRDMTFLWHQLQTNLGNPDILMYQLQRGNFFPFKTIFINIQSLSWWHDFSNLVGNIALFIPFGMFLVFLSKNKGMSFIGVLAGSLSLSLCLECLQVVFSLGIFDVDDLILNTSGGLLGYCVIKLYDKVYSKFIGNTSSIVQDRDIVEKQEAGEPYHK